MLLSKKRFLCRYFGARIHRDTVSWNGETISLQKSVVRQLHDNYPESKVLISLPACPVQDSNKFNSNRLLPCLAQLAFSWTTRLVPRMPTASMKLAMVLKLMMWMTTDSA